MLYDLLHNIYFILCLFFILWTLIVLSNLNILFWIYVFGSHRSCYSSIELSGKVLCSSKWSLHNNFQVERLHFAQHSSWFKVRVAVTEVAWMNISKLIIFHICYSTMIGQISHKELFQFLNEWTCRNLLYKYLHN